ncbi:MAG: phosphotransferase family protein [Dehalococcoidia bacterium]
MPFLATPMSLERAADLIRAHFPAYEIHSIEAMGHQGWGGDSDAFTVNAADIFRFPRYDSVREALAVEAALLPLLAPVLPLPIPHFTLVAHEGTGEESDGLSLFVGYPRIEGLQLTPERFQKLAPIVQRRFAEQLGEFIGALQRFPVPVARRAGVPIMEDARAQLGAFYACVREQLFPLLSERERLWVRDLLERLLADPANFAFEPVLSHSDLSGDHIIYDPDTLTLTGIIDFGDVQWGDPVLDFTGLLREYGSVFYGQAVESSSLHLDENAKQRLHFYLRRGPLLQMLHGVSAGRTADIDEGRRQLRFGSPIDERARP